MLYADTGTVQFNELPLSLQKVLLCESNGRHEDAKGKVIVSKTNDIGIAQINKYWHGKRAKTLGLDLHDVNDNLKYALILYTEQGLRPWVCAKILGLYVPKSLVLKTTP